MQPHLPLLDTRSECCINSSTYFQVSLISFLALCSSIGQSTKVRLASLAQKSSLHLEAEKNPHLYTADLIVLQTVDCKSSSFSSSDRSTSGKEKQKEGINLLIYTGWGHYLNWLTNATQFCIIWMCWGCGAALISTSSYLIAVGNGEGKAMGAGGAHGGGMRLPWTDTIPGLNVPPYKGRCPTICSAPAQSRGSCSENFKWRRKITFG